jgi:hypothetical protein
MQQQQEPSAQPMALTPERERDSNATSATTVESPAVAAAAAALQRSYKPLLPKVVEGGAVPFTSVEVLVTEAAADLKSHDFSDGNHKKHVHHEDGEGEDDEDQEEELDEGAYDGKLNNGVGENKKKKRTRKRVERKNGSLLVDGSGYTLPPPPPPPNPIRRNQTHYYYGGGSDGGGGGGGGGDSISKFNSTASNATTSLHNGSDNITTTISAKGGEEPQFNGKDGDGHVATDAYGGNDDGSDGDGGGAVGGEETSGGSGGSSGEGDETVGTSGTAAVLKKSMFYCTFPGCSKGKMQWAFSFNLFF